MSQSELDFQERKRIEAFEIWIWRKLLRVPWTDKRQAYFGHIMRGNGLKEMLILEKNEAAQLAQTKEGCVDIESPDSILVHTNIKVLFSDSLPKPAFCNQPAFHVNLLTKHTFASLPPLYQYRLVQLLPPVDRAAVGTDCSVRLPPSALNNEFFTRAASEWRDRLADGEFTPRTSNGSRWRLRESWPSWIPGRLVAMASEIMDLSHEEAIRSMITSNSYQGLTASPHTVYQALEESRGSKPHSPIEQFLAQRGFWERGDELQYASLEHPTHALLDSGPEIWLGQSILRIFSLWRYSLTSLALCGRALSSIKIKLWTNLISIRS
ncbi:ASXL2 [Cordylochernes scorpioides]|uniref:ASXL2 n=1 Tax=Cordylochernes scorpioides TaxID=51811 RepID=A0ABY6LB20_9ARAC|nr:ASXL2 [Cordylochernes scorpioides]